MVNYGLREKYKEISMFGDRLAEMEKLVDWEVFRTMLVDLYKNNTELGGRPNSESSTHGEDVLPLVPV